MSFTPLFKEAYEKSLSVSNIKNGFRKCGVYPFNKNPTANSTDIASEDKTATTPANDISITPANKTTTNVTTTAPANDI